jgi:hypothetical protein
MKGLTPTQLCQACRIFLAHAYPGGELSVPMGKRAYLHMASDQPLGPLLGAPVCQPTLSPAGEISGYALRLGCCHFPHLKLRVNRLQDRDEWVYSVDTHDAVLVPAGDPHAEHWTQLQAANRRLKEDIERAWEAAGLLTFNDLLRRELDA